jgi:putative membrane protein
MDKPDTNTLAEQRTDLALERTIMAADRTLMAWIRTAMSLIGFGFTFYKLLQYLQEGGVAPLMRLQGPRNLGLALIGLGVGTLTLSGIQYWLFMRRIGAPVGIRQRSPALFVAIVVVLMGLFALMNVLFAVGPF